MRIIALILFFALSTNAATITSPLYSNSANPNYFTNNAGQAVMLTGSQTWTSMQDMSTVSPPTAPAAISFDNYVAFLLAHNQNCTILWHKELPIAFNWGAGGTWQIGPHQWARTGPGNATDGYLKFDLNSFNTNYFNRLRARAIQLQTNGIYAIVELMDGGDLNSYRGAGDGYPYTGANNINGVDDGYPGSGSSWNNSITMSSANAITAAQDATTLHTLDTLNDLPNVLYEISEEASCSSTWWQGHQIALIHSYESTNGLYKHPVLYASLDTSCSSDSTLYNSDADCVAPKVSVSPTSSSGSGSPASKVSVNDSDHSYFYTAQPMIYWRNYEWKNFCNANQVLFMDPYLINWTSNSRNAPSGVSNGVGTSPDTKWDTVRDNMGYILSYAKKINLIKMKAQPSLASTTWCIANTNSGSAEYIAYATNGGTFTVNLTVQSGRTLNVQWLDASTGVVSNMAAISGGSSAQSFTAPASMTNDVALYLSDSSLASVAAPHNWVSGVSTLGIGTR